MTAQPFEPAPRAKLLFSFDASSRSPTVRIKPAPEFDTAVFNPRLLNCAHPSCQGKRSLQESKCKNGFVCALCGQFWDSPKFDDRPLASETDFAHIDSTTTTHSSYEYRTQSKSQESRLAVSDERSRIHRSLKQVDIALAKSDPQFKVKRQNERAKARALQALNQMFEDTHMAPQQEFALPDSHQLTGKMRTLFLPIEMLEKKRNVAPVLRSHAECIISDYLDKRENRMCNAHSLACAALVLSSREQHEKHPHETLRVRFETLDLQVKQAAKKINLEKSSKRYAQKIEQTLCIPKPSREKQIQECIDSLVSRIQRPEICAAYKKRIQSQLALLMLQIESHDEKHQVLRDRKPQTLAAGVLCAALWKMCIVYNGKRRLVSAQFVSQLSGVTHGCIQLVCNNVTKLGFGV